MHSNQQNLQTKESSVQEDSFKDIIKDMWKYSPAKIIGMLMNLAAVPIYTNMLLPGEYGIYGISIGFLSFIAIIFSDWVGLSALRFFKEHFKTDKIEHFFSSILFLIISNLTIMYFSVFIFAEKFKEFFKVPDENFILVMLLMIPIAFRGLMFQILRAQIKPTVYTVVVLINQFTTILAAICFIKYFAMGSKGILLGMMISIATIDIVLLLICKLGRSSKVNMIRKESLYGFYKYGIPIAVSSLGMWLITQSNKFVMQYYKGAEFNAYTGVGYSLTFSLLFPLFAIITLAGIPRIINRYESGQDVRKILTKLSGYFFIVFTPFVFLMCYFPQEIVLMFSNEKYINSAQIIPFLALSAMFFGITEYTVIQYHLIKKTYIHMLIKVLPNILGIFLTIFFIKLFPDEKVLLAVGVSALITQIIYFLASLLIRIKDLSWIPPYRIIFNALMSIFIGFVCILLVQSFLLKLLVFILAYMITMKLLFWTKPKAI